MKRFRRVLIVLGLSSGLVAVSTTAANAGLVLANHSELTVK